MLPISYGDAQPLLRRARRARGAGGWRGALPITYHVGPGPAKVHLKLAFDWDLKPVYNVIARIPGSERPDEWIIRGNHHDAWVNGAEDPVSGVVVLLEEARALGELLKQGWRPKRTIVYCAWDGEEPVLLGSTEWVEAHAEELRQHAVVYINTDGNGRGYLGMGGSHTLERFVNEVARDVEDPETKIFGVGARAGCATLARRRDRGGREEIRERARPAHRTRWDRARTTRAFLDHLGVAPRTSASAARTTAASTTPSTTTSTGTRTSPTPTSPTVAPWRRRSARP